MAWYWILLIVLGSIIGGLLLLYLLGFVFFIRNGDGKMIEKIYNFLLKSHEKHKREEKI